MSRRRNALTLILRVRLSWWCVCWPRPFGVRPFAGGSTGVQMAGWFNRELKSAADLNGLKMRIPGLAGEVFAASGGTAVRLAGGEIYTSMQTGVIDAVEWVGPLNDRTLGLMEVAEYYYYPGWHEPGAMLEFTVNQEAFDRLPADLQSIVEEAARATMVASLHVEVNITCWKKTFLSPLSPPVAPW